MASVCPDGPQARLRVIDAKYPFLAKETIQKCIFNYTVLIFIPTDDDDEILSQLNIKNQKKFWWLLNYWMLVALKFDAQPMMEWTPTTIALMRHFSNITLKKEGYFHHHNHQKYQNHNQNYHFHHYMVL